MDFWLGVRAGLFVAAVLAMVLPWMVYIAAAAALGAMFFYDDFGLQRPPVHRQTQRRE